MRHGVSCGLEEWAGPYWHLAEQVTRGSLVQGQRAGPHLVRFWRMRGTMLEGGPALARNGCFSSSAAVARWAGSRTSRRSRKPFRDGDTCGGGGPGEAQGTVFTFFLSRGIYCLGGAESSLVSMACPQGLFSIFTTWNGAGSPFPWCEAPSGRPRTVLCL